MRVLSWADPVSAFTNITDARPDLLTAARTPRQTTAMSASRSGAPSSRATFFERLLCLADLGNELSSRCGRIAAGSAGAPGVARTSARRASMRGSSECSRSRSTSSRARWRISSVRSALGGTKQASRGWGGGRHLGSKFYEPSSWAACSTAALARAGREAARPGPGRVESRRASSSRARLGRAALRRRRAGWRGSVSTKMPQGAGCPRSPSPSRSASACKTDEQGVG